MKINPLATLYITFLTQKVFFFSQLLLSYNEVYPLKNILISVVMQIPEKSDTGSMADERTFNKENNLIVSLMKDEQ